jgi:hypothetical protein
VNGCWLIVLSEWVSQYIVLVVVKKKISPETCKSHCVESARSLIRQIHLLDIVALV